MNPFRSSARPPEPPPEVERGEYSHSGEWKLTTVVGSVAMTWVNGGGHVELGSHGRDGSARSWCRLNIAQLLGLQMAIHAAISAVRKSGDE